MTASTDEVAAGRYPSRRESVGGFMQSSLCCRSGPGQLGRRLVAALSLTTVAVTPGCRDDSESPTAPATVSAVAVTATTALLFSQVSAGWEHTRGVTTDSHAYC